jgi:hypothetical protein
VFIVGGRQFTSGILQRNCHEFIAYENLIGGGHGASSGGGHRPSGRNVPVERTPLAQVFPLVRRALAVLTEREVLPQIGLLKSTLLQLDSTFSERNYGAGSFRDFVEKLAKANVLTIQQAKGGLLVGPAEGAPASDAAAEEETAARPAPEATGAAEPPQRGGPAAPVAVVGTPADGMSEFRKLLATAEVRRGPMYLRNVKQLFRQASPVFDERAFGYNTLVDLLRAAQKEGIVRVERDRQGVIRVFQGTAAPAAPPPAAPAEIAAAPEERQPDVVEPAEPVEPAEETDLSVGPGNSIDDPPHILESPRRRGRTAATPRTKTARRPTRTTKGTKSSKSTKESS